MITSESVCLWIHPLFVGETGNGLADYKIHCFNGEPEITLVCTDRFSEKGLCEDFFDNDWNHLDIRRPEHPNSDKRIQFPQNFGLMKSLAKRLARDIPFVRIDFYETNGKIYFGEITFFPASGMTPFVPEEWDVRLGKMVKLPSIQRK